MTRTLGAKDKKKRTHYAGKLIKKKKRYSPDFVPYNSTRHRGERLHVQIVQRVPMSQEGFRNWNKKIRPKVKRVVFKAFPALRVPPEDLSNEEGIGNVVLDDRQGEGVFDLRMQSSSKSKKHVSYRTKAIVRIIDTEEGLKAKVIQCWKINKYFFWRGK